MNVLFWSGGKDAWLALVKYREQYPENALALLTTYEGESGTVPHQQIPMVRIREQARRLGLDLLEVSLPPECPNGIYLEKVGETLENFSDRIGEVVDELVFGDWKLEDVREWREEKFGAMGYRCRFPIWKAELNDLMATLTLHPVEVRISAVGEDFRSILRVGERYNRELAAQLSRLDEIDPMGENGEFHTEVTFRDELPEPQARIQRPV